jgi:hypothetical protein
VLAVLAVALLALVLALSASAATGGSQAARQATFRAELTTYFAQLEQITATVQARPQGRAALARLGPDVSRTFARARDEVPRLEPSQLTVLQRALAGVPGWQQQPRMLRRVLRDGRSPRGAATTTALDETCAPPTTAIPHEITDVYVAKILAQAAAAVMEALPTDFASIVAREAFIVLWDVAENAALLSEEYYVLETDCGGAKLEHFTRTQLDVAVSTRASQASLDAMRDGIDARLDGIQRDIDLVGERQLEIIRLLHTPQERRASQVPACDGSPCRWPYSPKHG